MSYTECDSKDTPMPRLPAAGVVIEAQSAGSLDGAPQSRAATIQATPRPKPTAEGGLICIGPKPVIAA